MTIKKKILRIKPSIINRVQPKSTLAGRRKVDILKTIGKRKNEENKT